MSGSGTRGLYEPESRSRYAFWAGVNPAALGALAVGCAVYLLLLNPISFESAGVFKFISASIPAFLAATLAHVLLTKLMVQPLGKGGYTDHEKKGNDSDSG